MLSKESYAKRAISFYVSNQRPKRKYKQVFSEWKILRDKKQLIVDLETSIDEHQAFVYKILSQRITEVKEDFQRKSFSYWKLNEISQFLDDFSKKHSPQDDVKAKKSKP